MQNTLWTGRSVNFGNSGVNQPRDPIWKQMEFSVPKMAFDIIFTNFTNSSSFFLFFFPFSSSSSHNNQDIQGPG